MIRIQNRRRFRPVLKALALGGAGAGLIVASMTPAGHALEGAVSPSLTLSAASALAGTAAAPTVACPPVADRLPDVPSGAVAEVERNLNVLNAQIAEADRRLAAADGRAGRDLTPASVLRALRDARLVTLNRIASAIGRFAEPPAGLSRLAACTVRGGTATGGDPDTAPSRSAEPDASAQPPPPGPEETGASAGTRGGRRLARRVSCPSVADRLPRVPEAAGAEVRRNLALLDRQIAVADQRLARLGDRAGDDQIRNFVLNPLRFQRSAVLNRLAFMLRRLGADVTGLRGLASCAVRDGAGGGQDPAPNPGDDPTANPEPSATATAGDNGPSPGDFVDIRRVRPSAVRPPDRQGASTGTFVSRCGRNENGHHNSDNVIVAPGVTNGAHHVHDYVGNLDTNGFSTNESLRAAGTTCANGDRSTHYWPVLRLRRGRGADANRPGGGLDGNVGQILRPASVTLTLRGSPTGRVVAMPGFLRMITGDAKAFTNGPTNANALWTCTGLENRVLRDKYPLCPRGSQVVRLLRFQSCWDGENTDSANHRTHVAFPSSDGSCPDGFRAIPALEQRVTYNVPPAPVFALDSFPEQLHKPITDHGDFINVMPDALMRQAVNCINTGRRCG